MGEGNSTTLTYLTQCFSKTRLPGSNAKSRSASLSDDRPLGRGANISQGKNAAHAASWPAWRGYPRLGLHNLLD